LALLELENHLTSFTPICLPALTDEVILPAPGETVIILAWNKSKEFEDANLIDALVGVRNPRACPTNRTLESVICLREKENLVAEHVMHTALLHTHPS